MIGSWSNFGDYGSQLYGTGPAAASSTIASGATMSETQSAIDDSSDEGVVLSLGGSTDIDASPTYSAQGLLNSFVQAGTPLADASSTAPSGSGVDSGLSSAVQSDEEALLGAADANGVPGGSAYANSQSLWVGTLQTNPDMAGTLATDSLNQGLVGTLSAIA